MSKNMTTMPPVFVINLPKDTDRRIFMETQLQKLKIHYEIIQGRYGKDIEVVESCDDTRAIKEHGKVLTVGEKGCAFSHRSIYKKMEEEKIPYAVILEDDVVLPKNFSEIILQEMQKKNKNWDWVSFDYPKIGVPFVRAWMIASSKMIKKNKLFFLYALVKFPFIVWQCIT